MSPWKEPAMQLTAESVIRLIDEFNKLPGIGPKTAQRLTFHLLRMPTDDARALANAILEVKEKIGFCTVCFNITEQDPCGICRGAGRDATKICVVEEPLDVIAIERTGAFKGHYHVLHGAISPMEGIGPDELRIRELLLRLRDGHVGEIIFATNPNLEGEATAMYLTKLCQPFGIRLTRPARGLPVGGDLEYADEVTLTRAFEGRREY
jgi:recombination protein RecR